MKERGAGVRGIKLLVIVSEPSEEGTDEQNKNKQTDQAASDQHPGGEKAHGKRIGRDCPLAFVAGAVNCLDPPVVGARLDGKRAVGLVSGQPSSSPVSAGRN